MRNFKVLLSALVCASLIVASHGCKKNDEQIEELSLNSQGILYELDKIPKDIIDSDWTKSGAIIDHSKLLENPDDADDEKISKYLYEISLATRDLIKNPAFNAVIISLARNSETSTANLLDLESEAPNLYNSINAKLALKGLSLQGIADDLTHAPIAPNPDFPITSLVESYVPAIFIPNLERINENLQPIISPNVYVDSRFDQSLEDNIVAWYFESTTSTNVTEISLSEATSLNTSNPLFLLDNAVTSLETAENKLALPHDTEDSPQPAGQGAGILSFSSYEHSIKSQNYRYEHWTQGKSEFAVNAYRIEPNGTLHWIYSGNEDNSKVISKISLSQIGSMRYVWSHHASNWQPWSNPWSPTVTQNGVNMVFWNTFERDWHNSPKPLGTCTANGITIDLSGCRKYTSEWYTWIPETANIHYTKFNWIYDNWAHWNNSWKADFRLWRVHI